MGGRVVVKTLRIAAEGYVKTEHPIHLLEEVDKWCEVVAKELGGVKLTLWDLRKFSLVSPLLVQGIWKKVRELVPAQVRRFGELMMSLYRLN